jgi:lipopolysaccharide heptosyltransferase II
MHASPDQNGPTSDGAIDARPILLVPYMWIGDFVRCHSVVQVLKSRFPHRPVDMLATELNAPLADHMPGVRKAVLGELPRRRLAAVRNWELARRLRAETYGTALIMSRKWKAALAPFLAGIPERIGFVGEARFILLNDLRWGERKFPRMVDQCTALALPSEAALPPEWPRPELKVAPAEVVSWRTRRSLQEDGRPVIALAPGAVGASKRWPIASYAELARSLSGQGCSVWILGGPGEAEIAAAIRDGGGPHVRDLTGPDLRDAILALAAAGAAISNDSGLLHVSAALGTPTIGIFGPTSPWHWAPLNPLAATIETGSDLPCRPCHQPVCRVGHHRCMRDIPIGQVMDAVTRALPRGLALAT